ncbi:preprotein translocase subunit SecA [Candidatus Uhrbacteria bacterium]|nr:MAG: preprotein translocase subunit SecA [Candidatus Uhrbacteria bacterium]
MKFLTKLFGDPNAREVARLRAIVEQAKTHEAAMQALADSDFGSKTAEFKERLAKGESSDAFLPEAFALVREVSRRKLGQRQYDAQLIGGLALHRGMIAEMRTGEGKTLTATAPVYLNALSGKGVHVITVNDYLARRDAVWMGQVYHALGLSVACIQHAGSFVYDPEFKAEEKHDENRDATGSFRVDMDYLRPVSRREAYAADITYGTNNEFGFDFLRDNMVQRAEEMVQRELHYAVVDEVDSILIDEARTPLIISAPAEEATEEYFRFADVVGKLVQEEDYKLDEKQRASTLTEAGVAKLERLLNIENLYVQGGMRTVHHIEQALRAKALFKLDRDYVVRDGEVMIVDEFTGRLMPGRRYSEGLHQAIEAKERVKVQRESITLATITFQNYFRLYEKLSGMTGTAATEAEEFHKIYKLEVLSIPTNKDNQRIDLPDRVYKNEIGKFRAAVREIKMRHETGQPVLVGTVSIEKNELLSELLRQEGVPHEVLNAKNHAREAEIIAQAGRKGAVTVATNMAGRGVDILLGGNPPTQEEADEVRKLGGLHVLGTERHESRRIDNQLRGRSGRQGDPGSTQFYVSMEDDLMRIFGSDRMKSMMERLGVPEDEAIENKVLTSSLAAAQRKVEGHNFDIRKHLLEYDDVLNKHRMVIYKKRRDLLKASMERTENNESPLKPLIMEMVEGEVEQMVSFHTSAENAADWDLDQLAEAASAILPKGVDVRGQLQAASENKDGRENLVLMRTALVETLLKLAREAYEALSKQAGDPGLQAEVEKAVAVRALDDLWIAHLENMDYLRHGVGLQGYGQRDPLVEYKREAYRMFHGLLGTLNQRVASTIFKVQIARETAEEELRRLQSQAKPIELSGPQKETESVSVPSSEEKKAMGDVGRNDPCPCGSGKKYKKCHGV